MLLPIQTTARLSKQVINEILSVAINGACERWAIVSERERNIPEFPHFASAKFSPINDPSKAMTVSPCEIAAGVQRLLTEAYPCAGAVKEKVLRIVANDDLSEIDMEAASSIVRAAMAAGAVRVCLVPAYTTY